MNENSDRLVWTEEDLDDERAIETKPPWWGKPYEAADDEEDIVLLD